MKFTASILTIIFISSACAYSTFASEPGGIKDGISITVNPLGNSKDGNMAIPSSEFIQLELSIPSSLFNSQKPEVDKTIRAEIDQVGNEASPSSFSVLIEVLSSRSKEIDLYTKFSPIGWRRENYMMRVQIAIRQPKDQRIAKIKADILRSADENIRSGKLAKNDPYLQSLLNHLDQRAEALSVAFPFNTPGKYRIKLTYFITPTKLIISNSVDVKIVEAEDPIEAILKEK